jgi:hypothetical protein
VFEAASVDVTGGFCVISAELIVEGMEVITVGDFDVKVLMLDELAKYALDRIDGVLEAVVVEISDASVLESSALVAAEEVGKLAAGEL